MKKKLIVLLSVFFLFACNKNKQVDDVVNTADELENADGASSTFNALGVSYPAAIYFDFNSKELDDKSKVSLSAFAKLLNKKSDVEVVLIGKADNIGDPNYNYQLALERANAVKDYLVDAGVDGSRITTKSLGEKQQESFKNKSEAEVRKLNRKVVVEVSK